jgi:hypothetical protein
MIEARQSLLQEVIMELQNQYNKITNVQDEEGMLGNEQTEGQLEEAVNLLGDCIDGLHDAMITEEVDDD